MFQQLLSFYQSLMMHLKDSLQNVSISWLIILELEQGDYALEV
jgi:hypothetical protein